MLTKFEIDWIRIEVAMAKNALSSYLFSSNLKLQTRFKTLKTFLHFRGIPRLLVMENHLKEDTTQCITELSLSNTQVCMVTGDNILTAITVGKKCGIIPSVNHDVILMKPASREGRGVALQLDFRDDTSVVLSDCYTVQEVVEVLNQLSSKQHVFAVSSAAFTLISTFHPILYDLLLTRGKIFARMKPGQKQQLVEDLQKLGYIVSMCGDGANDCGALKASHAGVSLSEAEASIAAPFTSTTPSISCMLEVLRQGRAALVTASVTFRFMAMYSMIQFISVLLHYSFGSNMTDSQFLFIDLFYVYEEGGNSESKSEFKVTEDKIYDSATDKKFSLYSGTSVIQSKPSSGDNSVAIVIRTGFNTFKGSLIRSILCPKPIKFDFETDAKRFITMLSFFAACGFIYTAYISLKLGGSIGKTLRLGLDLVTVVVPPALPAALTIGVLYAVQRLKSYKIFCIEPQRINFCGKIQYICFDKTGTLTEDGLTVLSAIPSTEKGFSEPVSTGESLSQHQLLQSALASCHEISTIKGELVGDPLDVEMFKFTGWEIDDDGDMVVAMVKPRSSPSVYSNPELVGEDPEIGIIRAFPFTSDLQRMSVVCKDLNGGDDLVVFCKGSPEMIASLSSPDSIPAGFEETLLSYTSEGFRVIAFAWKPLEMPWHSVQTMPRSGAECDLQFIGLLVMENHLKEDTTQCITELSLSNTQVCMVTGDNILTAITVGKKCGIIPSVNHDVILMKPASREGRGVALQLDFRDDTSVVLSDCYTVQEVVEVLNQLSSKQHVFAVSSAAFTLISTFHPILYDLLLTRGKIFARMKPGQKQQLVEDLQKLGYIVSMCGDGANDCGALKASHAGVSLSEAEASIAAPFTSTTPSISCMLEVLRQGRAALVTASVTFRFMAMYSMIQFISVLLHYSFGWLYCLRLSLLQYLKSQPFFTPFSPNDELKEGACFENTALFTISGFQYALYGLVLMKGAPHRMPVYKNWLFLIVFVTCTALTGLFIFQPFPWLTNIMNLVSFETFSVQITFVMGVTINLLLAAIIEMVFSGRTITRFLENVRFFSRPKARYIQIQDQWGATYTPPPGEIAKDFELLAFLICFITLHNITVHNGFKSGIMRGISNVLVKVVFCVIVGGTLYSILPQVLEPGAATIIPLFLNPYAFFTKGIRVKAFGLHPGGEKMCSATLVFLMSDKPAAFTVPPISKGAGAEELRTHVDSLTTQLFKRLERVVVYFICINFIGLYLPFLFDKPTTIAKSSSCIGTQRIAAIIHLAVLLISKVFTVDLVMGLHEASLSIGRWQTAVVSTGSNSNIPEMKWGMEPSEGLRPSPGRGKNVATLVFLMSDKPAAFTVPPISKGAGAEELRTHVDSLTTQLFKRLERVVVYFICINFIGLYLPFLFDKPTTIAKSSSCIGTQRIAAIIHLAVLLISKVFTVDLVMGLHEASLSIGRWQTAVVSTGSNSNIPEMKWGMEPSYSGKKEHNTRREVSCDTGIPPISPVHPVSHLPTQKATVKS
eukprot:sb/3460862/